MSKRQDRDEAWMEQARRLAARGVGSTYPNPSVGAILVKGSEVVGKGRTARDGGPHAEVRALRRAGERARGATMYVTLEPCPHHGRTPPCADAIVAAGVRRLVIGVRDPAPHANGAGIRRLRRGGVEVVEGVGAAGCEAVHEHYLHHCRTGLPFVTLKAAVSLDGRIAVSTGDSKWITGERARTHAHGLRARHHAIMVGAATVRIDDPALTVRRVPGEDPWPVILDPSLGLAAGRWQALREGAIVFCGRGAPAARRQKVERTGARVVTARTRKGRLDLADVLEKLGHESVRSVLVEGGGRVHAAFVAAELWDRMFVYTAPRLLGEGPALLPGLQFRSVAEAPALAVEAQRRLAPDFLTVLRRARPGKLG